MPKAKTLFFTALKKVEIRETSIPRPKENEVLVETTCSAISAGTEMLVYRGQFPHLADARDGLSSDLNYPLAYGYACVGMVKEIGKGVNSEWLNRMVFAFHPHSSSFIIQPSSFSKYQPRRPPPDLHRKIRPAVPGIDLAHAGEEQAGDGRLDGGDVA